MSISNKNYSNNRNRRLKIGSRSYELSKQNQPIWDQFASKRLAEIKAKQMDHGEINEYSANNNVAQYKECAILLNSLQSDWHNLTLEQFEQAKKMKPQKQNHINGLVLHIYINKWVKINRDVAIAVIPVEYRQLVENIIQ
jgi:hypothetical protein